VIRLTLRSILGSAKFQQMYRDKKSTTITNLWRRCQQAPTLQRRGILQKKMQTKITFSIIIIIIIMWMKDVDDDDEPRMAAV
jgi:hypothetical protein